MSPATQHQRSVAPLKHGNTSRVMAEIINQQEVSPQHKEILAQERLDIWKKFQTPTLMLMDEYANFKTLVNMKMLKGEDPTSKEFREWGKFLLDITKELNRLTQVSADTKAKAAVAMSKGFNAEEDDEDIVIEVNGK